MAEEQQEKYIIVAHRPQALNLLQAMINKKLDEGYKVHGGLVACDGLLVQAMVLK